jgi:hypothetical protein
VPRLCPHSDRSSDLAAAVAEKATLEAEVNKVKAEATKAQRLSTLTAGGVAEAEATATVEKFSSLSDEQFAAIADLAIKAAKAAFPPKEDEKKDDKKKKDDKAKAEKAAASASLEKVEENADAALGGTSEEVDETEQVRASLAEYFATVVGQN